MMDKPLLCFKDFVPVWLRIVLFILFAVIFQCASPVYLSLMGDVTGVYQLYREDLSFVYQVSTIGVTFIFPILFRIKFRFTSQQILSVCSLLLAVLLLVCMYTSSVPVLIVCAFFIGAFKMIGTFETLVSLQLIITRQKDYGMFFSVALAIVLLCGQLSATLAVILADSYEWQMIYNLIAILLGLQTLLILLLLRPFRIVKPLPLLSIDWKGIFHWSVFFSLISYVLTYGHVLDWYSSQKIMVATMAALLWFLLIVYRSYTIRRALILPRVFGLKNVQVAILVILIAQVMLNTTGSILGPFTGSVMRLDNLHTGDLNWWIAGGILTGAVMGYFWFKYINGPFRVIFAVGFAALTLHHGLLYFAFSGSAGEQQLYLPYFLKGLGNIIIFAAAAKYVTIGVGFDVFAQMLCYVAMFRNALGNAIMGAFFSENVYRLSQDYLQKLASKMDASRLEPLAAGIYNQSLKSGSSSFQASQLASKAIAARLNQQAMLLAGRDIFGWVTVFGVIVLIGICLYHFSSPLIKTFPSWQNQYKIVKRDAL